MTNHILTYNGLMKSYYYIDQPFRNIEFSGLLITYLMFHIRPKSLIKILTSELVAFTSYSFQDVIIRYALSMSK